MAAVLAAAGAQGRQCTEPKVPDKATTSCRTLYTDGSAALIETEVHLAACGSYSVTCNIYGDRILDPENLLLL